VLPIVYPVLAFLGLAILAELGDGSKVTRHRKSIEACTADIRAMWIKEDGVIRVYHEVININCARIVVECTNRAPSGLPGEIEGHPILARIQPHYGLATGAAGIRGMPTFRSYSNAEMDAIRRDEAAQGLRSVSVAPPG